MKNKEYEVWSETTWDCSSSIARQDFVKASSIKEAKEKVKKRILKDLVFNVFEIPDGDKE